MSKISCIIAIRNEGENCRKAVESLLQDRTGNDDLEIEILAIDGRSDAPTKETLQQLAQQYSNNSFVSFKVLDNENITAPYAFNLGIQNATGDYVAILGSHCIYKENYLRTCINEIVEKGADVCGGVVKQYFPDNAGLWEEISAGIQSSKIGVSGNSFRTAKSGFVESVPYGVFKREVFEKVGIYNTQLTRNQDNDMNTRILKAGFKMYLTDKCHAIYKGSLSYKGLLKYAFRNGFWNSRTLFISPGAMRIRHFVPLYFVLFLIGFPLLGLLSSVVGFVAVSQLIILAYFAILLVYFSLAVLFTPRSNKHLTTYILFPFAVFVFHLSYGLGNLSGLFAFKK